MGAAAISELMSDTLANVVPGPTHEARKAKAASVERERMSKWLEERIAAGRSSDIITLTPVLAELLLERNTQNRPRAQSNVDVLVRENAEGRFLFNGESISVRSDGVLSDGQHRCEMVVLTGKPVETSIVFGIDKDAVRTINIGKSRSAANVLAMDGFADSNVVSTIASLIWQWDTNGRLAFASSDRPTKTQVVAAASHYQKIAESVEFCKRKRTRLVAPNTTLAFCHWAFKRRAGEEAANTFLIKLIDGDRPNENDPICHARNRLLGIRGWVFPQVRASLIFQAWNLWRKGQSVPSRGLKVNLKSLPELER